ncbi:hypothetical protein BN1708_019640, partial [Verticillium longisporum]
GATEQGRQVPDQGLQPDLRPNLARSRTQGCQQDL